MSDARTRKLARSDDPAAKVALLTERLRAGELTLERLRLAAYAGHEPAWTVLGGPRSCPKRRAGAAPGRCARSGCWDCARIVGTRNWLRGLEWWPWSWLCASIAAARVVLVSADWEFCCDGQHCSCRGMPIDEDWHRGHWAIDAAATWLKTSDQEHFYRWWIVDGVPDWAPRAYGYDTRALTSRALQMQLIEQIETCEKMLPRVNAHGKHQVNEAMRKALITWSLEGP